MKRDKQQPNIAPENYLWVCLENGKYSKVRSKYTDSWDEYSAENSRLVNISHIMWNTDHTKIVAVAEKHS